jgi:hypothetical protein
MLRFLLSFFRALVARMLVQSAGLGPASSEIGFAKVFLSMHGE